ncbi:helix-turn-helix transcriptional regulator [Pseudomonas koreensis]|uniref:helix-turn-helix transcriptional regulator n=1 Tax=Pseudomonas koreensis TaxID=198620 RepID=UPI001B320924|nr:helix-turn-helix transcriptional regulator [Pseudomonas koreensis]MBP4001526.1 helix-turn-helix transcriptional regulator [Pseudomonas koreensis]
MSNIGKRITKAREKAGLNQSELARALGVKPQSVQAWESGRNVPRHKKIEAISVFLGIPIMDLIEPVRVNPVLDSPVSRLRSDPVARRPELRQPLLESLIELLRKPEDSGGLSGGEISILLRIADAFAQRGASPKNEVPRLPIELDALAESAFVNADSGGDSEDMVNMIGHGLKKSGAKESSSQNAKRKNGTD